LCTNMLHIELQRHRLHSPYYLQIVEQIRSNILSGELPAGMQLPPSRQLAIELGIARRTVVIAYEELCAQGYCVSQVGRGTVVAPITTVSTIAPVGGASLQENRDILSMINNFHTMLDHPCLDRQSQVIIETA
jgi:DNA-binding transcriptional regulator YhcF (GntR family)